MSWVNNRASKLIRIYKVDLWSELNIFLGQGFRVNFVQMRNDLSVHM